MSKSKRNQIREGVSSESVLALAAKHGATVKRHDKLAVITHSDAPGYSVQVPYAKRIRGGTAVAILRAFKRMGILVFIIGMSFLVWWLLPLLKL